MHEPADTTLLESEILIGRLIDGEAADADRRRFEALASEQSGLWQVLARRQLDMGLLAERVGSELDQAERIDLPVHAAEALAPGGPGISRSLLMWSGWAAMVAIAAWWWGTSLHDLNANSSPILQAGSEQSAAKLTPDEHLALYRQAPFVMGELAPTLLQVEQMPDGSKVIHFLRRFEETAVIPAGEEPPVTDGKLTKEPAQMRSPD